MWNGANGVLTSHVCPDDGVKNYQCDKVSNGMILLSFVKIGQLVFVVESEDRHRQLTIRIVKTHVSL
jgi:hypothetical protein